MGTALTKNNRSTASWDMILPLTEVNKETVFETEKLNLWYGETQALKDIDLTLREKEVTAIIGPSGCGKSTYLKTLNRMAELVPNVRTTGKISYRGTSIFDPSLQPELLRTEVGMVFQKANPFPKSIFENIAYGPRIHGIKDKQVLQEIVETSLRKAYIWEEVKDRLHNNARSLSGGQQQRLCIARSLAIAPKVILMDEPTSALDPKSTQKVEELIGELKKEYTIVMVTHNMQQAARVSDRTAFFLDGRIVEEADTKELFQHPKEERTAAYIHGQFG